MSVKYLKEKMSFKDLVAGEITTVYTWSYDEKGNVIEEKSEFYYPDRQKTTYRTVYVRDDTGIIVKTDVYENDVYTSYDNYTMRCLDDPETIEHYKLDGTKTGYATFKQSEDGISRERLSYNGAGDLVRREKIYYDSKNHEITKIMESDFASGVPKQINIGILDPDSNHIMAQTHFDDGNTHVIRNELFRDEHGNVIKVLGYQDSSTEPVNETIIEYKTLNYEGLKLSDINALGDELKHLKTVRRKEISEKLRAAREKGNLSENPEYDAAKEEQREVEDRIDEIEKRFKEIAVSGQ